jgi:hypothetical protein
VRLPLRRFHDFGQRRALGALHHRDLFRLLVGAIALRLYGLVGAALFLVWLGLLAALRFGFASADSGVVFTASIAFSLIEISP